MSDAPQEPTEPTSGIDRMTIDYPVEIIQMPDEDAEDQESSQ